MSNTLSLQDKQKLALQILRDRYKPKLPSTFDPNEICFKEQLAFVMDNSRWVTGSCSRRAGKSVGCTIDLMITAASTPNVNCLYITLTFATAERLVWGELNKLNDKYKFGGIPNQTKLTMKFPKGGTIYLSGCDNKADIEKFRGMALKLVYIDEVQSFRPFIRELVDEVLGPALMDNAGSLKFIGTPAPLKRGYFWEVLQKPIYSHHKWTFWENTKLPALKMGYTHERMLDEELERRGVSIDDPSIRREWFGEWVDDVNALVCLYNPKYNHYEKLPTILHEYIIGVDIGYNDADAIAVIGWNKYEKKCYLVEELVRRKQGITELTDQLTVLYEKYNPMKIVMDEGGLGKKIGEELRKRTTLPIFAAEKSQKQLYIALMNDAFLTKSFYIKNTTRFASDSQLIEWDFDKSTSDKKVIKDDPHSDIFDAVLYAYREALHWLSEPTDEFDPKGKSWEEISERQAYANMEMREAKKVAEKQEKEYWESQDEYDINLTDAENSVKFYLNNRKKE